MKNYFFVLKNLQNTYLKEFLPLIKDFPNYPIIRDTNNVVMSLPPIINSNHSKMSKDTKNVFIEITAVMKNKNTINLALIIT